MLRRRLSFCELNQGQNDCRQGRLGVVDEIARLPRRHELRFVIVEPFVRENSADMIVEEPDSPLHHRRARLLSNVVERCHSKRITRESCLAEVLNEPNLQKIHDPIGQIALAPHQIDRGLTFDAVRNNVGKREKGSIGTLNDHRGKGTNVVVAKAAERESAFPPAGKTEPFVRNLAQLTNDVVG